MESYLSNIDNYIQEQDDNHQQQQQQQQQQHQLFYLQQQQQQQQQQAFNPSQWPNSFTNGSYGQPVMSIPQQSMYVPNMMNYQPPSSMTPPPPSSGATTGMPPPPPPGFDLNGNPIKIRKKPGRKPNPASPALRKAQNRAAQRAFRERKENHLKSLENTIRTLRDQRNSTAKELKKTKNRLEVFKTENWYLKGVMLTLQFMCMHHNIDLPPHTPYLAEETLVEIGKTHPHAIEAYVNAYTRNNINLKPNLTAHFANLSTASISDHHRFSTKNKSNSQQQETTPSPSSASASASTPYLDQPNMDMGTHSPPPLIPVSDEMDHTNEEHHNHGGGGGIKTEQEEDEEEGTSQHLHLHNNNERASTPSAMSTTSATTSTAPVFEHEDVAKWTMDDALNEEDDDDDDDNDNGHGNGKDGMMTATTTSNSTSAIQRIRLQLRVQSTLSTISGDHLPSERLQPTLLQLAIAHDPRIDLIPAPQMRDRMIIFRDQMDYDRCFSMLLNGAVYHGGDPTLSQSWELPPSFHSEYWFLSSRYDLDTTNRWRRLKNLPEIPPGGPDRRWTPPPLSGSVSSPPPPPPPLQSMTTDISSPGWSEALYSPNAQQHMDLMVSSPQASALSPPPSRQQRSKHPLYDKVLGSPPEMRHPVTSPTLDVMMTMMNSMNTL